jgi:hypothetical protein
MKMLTPRAFYANNDDNRENFLTIYFYSRKKRADESLAGKVMCCAINPCDNCLPTDGSEDGKTILFFLQIWKQGKLVKQ